MVVFVGLPVCRFFNGCRGDPNGSPRYLANNQKQHGTIFDVIVWRLLQREIATRYFVI